MVGRQVEGIGWVGRQPLFGFQFLHSMGGIFLAGFLVGVTFR